MSMNQTTTPTRSVGSTAKLYLAGAAFALAVRAQIVNALRQEGWLEE